MIELPRPLPTLVISFILHIHIYMIHESFELVEEPAGICDHVGLTFFYISFKTYLSHLREKKSNLEKKRSHFPARLMEG